MGDLEQGRGERKGIPEDHTREEKGNKIKEIEKVTKRREWKRLRLMRQEKEGEEEGNTANERDVKQGRMK